MPQTVDWNTAAIFLDQRAVIDKDPLSPTYGRVIPVDTRNRKHAQWSMPLPDGTFNYAPGDTPYRYVQIFERLTSLFPMLTTDRILIMGCGQGYTIEAFLDNGYTETYGLEMSDRVLTDASAEIRPDVLSRIAQLDMQVVNAAQSKNLLNSVTGAKHFDWLVTEFVLESFDDTDVAGKVPLLSLDPPQGINNANDPGHVIHLVYEIAGAPFIARTLEEYVVLVPDGQRFVSGNTWRVL